MTSEEKDVEIAKWAIRAHNAEAMLVQFDKLHADGKFLQSKLGEAFGEMAKSVQVAAPSGVAHMMAVPLMPDDCVVMVCVADGRGYTAPFPTTRDLMRVLHKPAELGWQGEFLALMSKASMVRSVQDVAEMRVWMTETAKDQPFAQPGAEGKQ